MRRAGPILRYDGRLDSQIHDSTPRPVFDDGESTHRVVGSQKLLRRVVINVQQDVILTPREVSVEQEIDTDRDALTQTVEAKFRVCKIPVGQKQIVC